MWKTTIVDSEVKEREKLQTSIVIFVNLLQA